MHLEPHGAQASTAPCALAKNPAEVEDPHAFDAIATDTELVQRSLGTKVQVLDPVREHAQRCQEVFVRSGATRRDRRASDERQLTFTVSPEDENRLHLGAAIHQQEVLGGLEHHVRAPQGRLDQARVCALLLTRNVQAWRDFLLKHKRELGACS